MINMNEILNINNEKKFGKSNQILFIYLFLVFISGWQNGSSTSSRLKYVKKGAGRVSPSNKIGLKNLTHHVKVAGYGLARLFNLFIYILFF